MILDKPAGLPCHPTRAGGASVEDWFGQLSRRRTGPWLAHRLDADTAGCLAVALRKATLIALQSLFATHAAGKTYWAIVTGKPGADAGIVDLPLARRSDRKNWWMQADPAGQPAQTAWRVAASDGRQSWLELTPRTGRTHQIRVHCASLGCPIVAIQSMAPRLGGCICWRAIWRYRWIHRPPPPRRRRRICGRR